MSALILKPPAGRPATNVCIGTGEWVVAGNVLCRILTQQQTASRSMQQAVYIKLIVKASESQHTEESTYNICTQHS